MAHLSCSQAKFRKRAAEFTPAQVRDLALNPLWLATEPDPGRGIVLRAVRGFGLQPLRPPARGCAPRHSTRSGTGSLARRLRRRRQPAEAQGERHRPRLGQRSRVLNSVAAVRRVGGGRVQGIQARLPAKAWLEASSCASHTGGISGGTRRRAKTEQTPWSQQQSSGA